MKTRDALLAFVGFPDLSPENVLDLLEASYKDVLIGSVRVSKGHSGFLLSTISRQQAGLSGLAKQWAAAPIWPNAILIPLNGSGKPTVPMLPLPALLLKQVPFGRVKELLFNFQDSSDAFLKNSDPTDFPSWKRIRLVRNYIENDAYFSDIRLLTTLKSNADDQTPVTLALYPASFADFSLGLSSRTIVGCEVYYLQG
jgi:hypothetical protein